MPRERLPDRRPTLLTDLGHDGSSYNLCVGFKPDGSPGEIFITGSKSGSHMDGLLSDIGVLLSRLLQHGDGVAELAAGTGRLGDGGTPASIIGAVLDKTCGQAIRPPGDTKAHDNPKKD